jgi:competence protein ComEC
VAERQKTAGQAATWWPSAGTRAAVGARPGFIDTGRQLARRAADRIRTWAIAEVSAGRMVPWIAIAFGCGIVVYFAIDQEPAAWAAVLLLCIAASVAVLCRKHFLGFVVAMGVAAVVAGFAAAAIKRVLIAHPVLLRPAWNVDLAGFVEAREQRERSDRITLRVVRMTGIGKAPERVRISVRKGSAPRVGAFVELKARLSPPLPPLRPGGYDFARDMYFQGIGASGFVLGKLRTADPPHAHSFWLRYSMVIDGVREAIHQRIRAVLPGDRGSIASALITGKRDAIAPQLNEAMYVSGLGHVLSISGYHMAVVAGLVFFAVRGLLAPWSSFANRHPIKKWAALVALLMSTFYLLLSGAEVATQRSYIMIGIVLIGVLLDRAVLTFRTLTVAALGVLLLAPEAIVHPSFQMSFAATLALIAGYQLSIAWTSSGRDTPLAARLALWGGREIIGLTIVSLLAGTATIPYVAYHFHRASPYGVLANLAAMPVVSGWVMPWGIVGLFAMPLGLDLPCWQFMGWGIDWMTAVSTWVASLPGSLWRVPAFGAAPLLICTLGLVILCLLRTPLRLAGAVLITAAVLMMIRAPQPDILVAADAETVAVRGSDGKLGIVRWSNDTFAMREWLAADADPRGVKDESLANGIRCDDAGCIARLHDGQLVAVVRTAEAFEEDCLRAVVVISARQVPASCPALVIGRRDTERAGALALRRVHAEFEITPARPPTYNRPWAPQAAQMAPAAESRVQSLDATPAVEDLDPGD